MLHKCLSPVVGLIKQIAAQVWKLLGTIIARIMSALEVLDPRPSTTGQATRQTPSVTLPSESKKPKRGRGRPKKSQTARTTR
jgi:hypothetical protein